MPGSYADVKMKMRPRDKPQFATLPPTPLEIAESNRVNREYHLARMRQLDEGKPRRIGLDASKSDDIRYLGVMQDYPDRMVQRDPNADPYAYDPRSAETRQWYDPRRSFYAPPLSTPQRPMRDDEHDPPPGYPRVPPEEYFPDPTYDVKGNRSRMREVDPWVKDPGERPWENPEPSLRSLSPVTAAEQDVQILMRSLQRLGR
jgi:hypothetical protein